MWAKIKNKLQDYELPYDESQWLRLQYKLPKKIIKTWHVMTTLSVVIISLGLWFYTPKTIPTQKVKQRVIEIVQPIPYTTDTFANYEVINTPQIVAVTIPKDTIIIVEDSIITIPKTIKELVQKLDTVVQDTNIIVSIEEVDSMQVFNNVIIQTTIPEQIYMANAFTPNGDGINDYFGPIGVDLESKRFQFLIYNKWGELIFETMQPEVKWRADNCETGSYIWFLILEDRDGNKAYKRGSVYVIK